MSRPLLLAECFVNQTILSWILKPLHRTPLHCRGVNDCVRKLEKRMERSEKNDRIVLLIDYEERTAQRSIIDKRIERYRCEKRCRTRTISIYTCLKCRITIILFNGPPEEFLARSSKKHRLLLEDSRKRRLFKSKAADYIGVDPRKGYTRPQDYVLEGLCVIYSLIRGEAGECLALALGLPHFVDDPESVDILARL